LRDELLNETLFFGLDPARSVLDRWVADFNACRPHSALGYRTPAASAAHLTARVIAGATPTSSADPPLLPRRTRATLTPGLWLRLDEQRGSRHTPSRHWCPAFR
jgi:putative transposase